MGKNSLSLRQRINAAIYITKGETKMTEAIKAKLRTSMGSSESKKLREAGKLPGVVYGSHSDTRNIELDLRAVEHLLAHHGVGATVDVDIEGTKVFTMLKDVQKNLFKNQLLHIDLQELTMGEPVKVSIPIHFVNKDQVEDSVLIVVEQVHSIDMEVLPKDLIESYDVDVAVLKDQPSITMAELGIFNDERYTVYADADTVVASLTEGGSKEPDPVAEEDGLLSVTEEVVDQASDE